MKKAKKPVSVGKKLLLWALAAALVVGGIYLGWYLIRFTFFNDYRQSIGSYTYEQGTELTLQKKTLPENKDYKLVTETDVLEMYLNEATTDVAILDKRTGVVTYAVPPEAENDPVANGVNKNYLRSHIIVHYFNAARTEGIYDSWSMAVERGQFTFEGIENGLRVIYELGNFANSTGIVPQYLTEEKFAQLAALLPEEDAQALGRYYSTTSDVAGMRQLLKTARNNRNVQKKLQAMLDLAGWTEEDYVEQMALAGSSVVVPISFKVALEYRLEDDHVSVSVPVCALEENGGAAIFRIQLLRSFAAADSNTDGYMVVPNGDGSIIRYNNGKTKAANYSQFLYGIDMLAADYTVLENAENATLPLFGMCTDKATVLATVEEGSSLASVNAGISGKVNDYNYAYTAFVIRGSETLEMFGTTGNEAALPIVEPDPYNHNLTVRYSFLDEDHAGYAGIANYYRRRLLDEGVLQLQQEKELKFYYDVISGVEMTEFFLGKQYMGLTAMTTFDEARQISDALAQAGISNQVMNLQGWFNGGYYHDVADRIRVPAKLGGKSGLEALNATLAENGGTLYADVLFQKVPYNSKRFVYQAETSKYYGSGYTAGFGQVSPVTLRQTSSLGYVETMYDLVSPKFLVRYTQAFADKIQKYDIGGISLRDLGSQLHSDKKRTGLITREEALDVVLAELERMDQTGKNILVNEPNAYALGFADDLMNLPLDDNEYIIVDEAIPLYEMIVHGCIDYCGDAYNLTDAGDDRQQILNMIEYGAAPHFLFTWSETTEMKYSGLNSNYATTFHSWKDVAAGVYEEVSRALNPVTGATMNGHEILENGIRKCVYSNGVVIYINYTAADLTADGITVPALGWAVG